jgi:hypothetical protein
MGSFGAPNDPSDIQCDGGCKECCDHVHRKCVIKAFESYPNFDLFIERRSTMPRLYSRGLLKRMKREEKQCH